MAVLIEPHPVQTDQAQADPAQVLPLLTGLTRARGGTFSPTVHVIHFADGTSAHTDLIRLNPNIDAYSLDFTGVSPRQLCHYREVPAAHAPMLGSSELRAAIGAVLSAGYPHRSTAKLTDALRAAGHRLGHGHIREHEAIAATQAALWHLTNGLDLDTRPLDEPVRAISRIGERPSSLTLNGDSDGLAWRTVLPAGETAHLELTLAGEPQLQAFGFSVGSRTGRHTTDVHLESSVDGTSWYPVSLSGVTIGERRPGWQRVRRQLGAAATVSSAGPSGDKGHRHYRLAARGPETRDGLLDLRQIHLELAGGERFRNDERVVALYRLLLEAIRSPQEVWWQTSGTGSGIARQRGAAGSRLDLTRRTRQARVRTLIGSRTPLGPAVFTPLVALAGPDTGNAVPEHNIRLALVG